MGHYQVDQYMLNGRLKGRRKRKKGTAIWRIKAGKLPRSEERDGYTNSRSSRNMCQINPKILTSKHIIIKLLKDKTKKPLKAARKHCKIEIFWNTIIYLLNISKHLTFLKHALWLFLANKCQLKCPLISSNFT